MLISPSKKKNDHLRCLQIMPVLSPSYLLVHHRPKIYIMLVFYYIFLYYLFSRL